MNIIKAARRFGQRNERGCGEEGNLLTGVMFPDGIEWSKCLYEVTKCAEFYY